MSSTSDPLAAVAVRSREAVGPPDPLRLGHLEKVYLIWLGGASCEGCTVAVSGGAHPRIEQLLAGLVPGLPRVELIHTMLSTESGEDWVSNLAMAEAGELDAPYVLTWEGSVMDESTAGGGYWGGLGEDPATGRQITSREWLDRLAPGAAAVFAIGTCATWGGIPAAKGNPTGAGGVGQHLGPGFRSACGVPLVNVPGCAPVGDNFLETVASVLLFLNGLAPLPHFDDQGRPAWLFGETVHGRCPRAGYYEDGVFAADNGDAGCLVELGCWGPAVQCNIAGTGVIDGHGGCMSMGGICIGCTMPGFPDRFSPIGAAPVGLGLRVARVSQSGGAFLRRARHPAAPALGAKLAAPGHSRSRFYRRPQPTG